MKSTRPTRRLMVTSCGRIAGALLLALSASALASAILVQPHNYMLDDSALTSQHDASGSLSPFYNDQTGANERAADKDIVSIIGDGLARLRLARMLDQTNNGEEQHLSQEMAELIQNEQQVSGKQQEAGDGSLSSSVASMLLNVAQAAAAQANEERNEQHQEQAAAAAAQDSSRGPILELDTTQAVHSQPSKADLKSSGPSQWFNPKETIPVLKISSMATPSKYKKVYFRSEKKLVDGAFHSPAGEHDESKKSLVKSSFNSNVQRRSSRGSSAAAPPSVLQDGVIDFLKKFRDVYVQTRPAGAPSSGANFASNFVAAASSPLAAFLAPGSASGSSRPNFASALSTAMLSQAASSSPSSSSSSGSSIANAASSAASTAAGAAAGGATTNTNKPPLSAQTYVSFWSKTFPTWVRKMLKQMRRRSLYNSSKRQQQQHQHGGLSQKLAASAVSGVTGDSSSSGSSSGSSSSGSSSSSA